MAEGLRGDARPLFLGTAAIAQSRSSPMPFADPASGYCERGFRHLGLAETPGVGAGVRTDRF